MSKTNANKSYAEQGLEDVTNETTAAEANIGQDTEETNFVQVGGLEPVEYYYRTSAPKRPTKSLFKIIEKGETVTGTYLRSFTTGKFKSATHLIRLENGKVVGLPGAGSLTKAINKLEEGSKVKITYQGTQAIKGGQWAGNDAHVFTVFGNKFKTA